MLLCLVVACSLAFSYGDTVVSEDRLKILRLMSVMSGHFVAHHPDNDIGLKIIPVEIPALFPVNILLKRRRIDALNKSTDIAIITFKRYKSVSYYLEEHIANLLLARQVITLHIKQDGLIYGYPHSFVGSKIPIPGEFNITTLQLLEKEDLTKLPKCVLRISELTNNIFFGTWPFCSFVSDSIPVYVTTWTCGKVGIVNNDNLNETDIFQINKRYPLPEYMLKGIDNYIDPCSI